MLPVLDAAHIKPYAKAGAHRLDNGLLFRRDFHALFDCGYITVTPDFHLEVSRRVRDDWDNGQEYYRWHGQRIETPQPPFPSPKRDFLEWHNENVYRG